METPGDWASACPPDDYTCWMRYFIKMTFRRGPIPFVPDSTDVLKIWLNLGYRDLNRYEVGKNAAHHVAKWIGELHPEPIIRDNVKIVWSVDRDENLLESEKVY